MCPCHALILVSGTRSSVCSKPHPKFDKLPDEADVLDAVLDLTRRFLPQEVPALGQGKSRPAWRGVQVSSTTVGVGRGWRQRGAGGGGGQGTTRDATDRNKQRKGTLALLLTLGKLHGYIRITLSSTEPFRLTASSTPLMKRTGSVLTG